MSQSETSSDQAVTYIFDLEFYTFCPRANTAGEDNLVPKLLLIQCFDIENMQGDITVCRMA